eukprot:4353956-Pleurochrysis_carterae.AAC.1
MRSERRAHPRAHRVNTNTKSLLDYLLFLRVTSTRCTRTAPPVSRACVSKRAHGRRRGRVALRMRAARRTRS